MDSYFEVFEIEMRENLGRMEDSLLSLEKNPMDVKGINEIHRSAHTIKGMTAAMGFNNLSALAHAIEDKLSIYSKEKRAVEGDVIDLLLDSVSFIEKTMDRIKEKKEEPETGEMIQNLRDGIKREKGRVPEVKRIEYVTVRVEILDLLLNLVGEMVVSKNRLKEITKESAKEVKECVSDLENLVSFFQNDVLKMRLLPIKHVFGQFSRIVRELSSEENKRIDLIIEGEETEMDRSMMDGISEPLVHIIRNSVDHGIETIEERKSKGKSEEGRIWLRARREGNSVIIEVEDDGNGIDWEKVRDKGMEKGLIDQDVTREELTELIFLPSFSTSEKITKVSGRGIGLDVVRSVVESFKGTIGIESGMGKGTKFTLKFPFTLMISNVLLVELEGDTYAIPMDNVRRIVDIKDVKTIEGEKVLLLQEGAIPLIDSDVFSSAGKKLGIIFESGERYGCIGVNSIIGIENVVVRPLQRGFAQYFSGSTLLGDGSAVFILDPSRLIS